MAHNIATPTPASLKRRSAALRKRLVTMAPMIAGYRADGLAMRARDLCDIAMAIWDLELRILQSSANSAVGD